MHKVLVNHLGGLSLPRKSVVRLTDRPDMTLDVYRGRKTTTTTCKGFNIRGNKQETNRNSQNVPLLKIGRCTFNLKAQTLSAMNELHFLKVRISPKEHWIRGFSLCQDA